ncbi:MAG TPA: DUF2007 domain-containing protein [Candidatus Hydrogenedentes bacterium]|nr:DUF2007 domain-containing protein [Candidatus Hydrogenedentota bacterium]HNT90022.1 DUF2007 domain-containing protein [Candidatus Hydrogenedentota bacterium]
MHDEFVVIGRFFDSGKAHLLKTVLESHGIDAFVQGEFTGTLEPAFSLFGGGGKGGIQLLVREEDAAEARAILEDA